MNLDDHVFTKNSRLDLLKAAIQIFSEKHFDGAGIRELADTAGVNSSLIYFHFGDKAGLYAEALRLACRMVKLTVKHLPEPPEPEDPAATQKATLALTEYIRMFVRMSLRQGRRDSVSPSSGLEKAVFALVTRELSSPRAETEPHLMDAIQPHASHVHRCLRILRPDLDSEGIFRVGMSIHGQLLYFFSHQRIVSLQHGGLYQDADLEPLVEHFTRFSLLGVKVSEPRVSS